MCSTHSSFETNGCILQILLSIAAVIFLSLDIFQDSGQPRPDGEPPADWVEGVTILVTIPLFILVWSLNNWKREKQFKLLNEKREERAVEVIRDGEEQMIYTHTIVVGDVTLFEPGSLIPCDGIFATDSSNLNATRTPQLMEPFNASSVNSAAFEDVDPDTDTVVSVGSKTENALSKFARSFGWASFKGTRNGTNLISFSSDLQAILYSRSVGEVITPRCMRNVVVFYGPRLGQSHRPILRDRRREHHETASRDHRPALRRAPQEGNLHPFPNVVPTRRRTASETTARDVGREIRTQPIAPSRGQQLSTAETSPRDLSNGLSSTQLQPYAAASSPSPFRSHDDNAIVGNPPPSRESLPAADDSTGVLYPNGDGNEAIGLDSFSRLHIANRAERSTARHGWGNPRAPVVVAVASGVIFLFLLLLFLAVFSCWHCGRSYSLITIPPAGLLASSLYPQNGRAHQ